MKTNEEILKDAPEGATHFQTGYQLYYKFENATHGAFAFIDNSWVPYPLYDNIHSLYHFEVIRGLEQRINNLLK